MQVLPSPLTGDEAISKRFETLIQSESGIQEDSEWETNEGNENEQKEHKRPTLIKEIDPDEDL